MIGLGINLNKSEIQLIPRDDEDVEMLRKLAENIGIFGQDDAHLITARVKRIPSVKSGGRLISRERFEIKFWKGDE